MSAPTKEEMQENIDKLQLLKGHIIEMKILCKKYYRPLFGKEDGTEVYPSAENKTAMVTEYQARKAELPDLFADLL